MKRTNPTTGIDIIGIDINAKVQESRQSLQRQDTFILLFDYTPYFEDLGFKETCHAGRSVAPAKRFHFIKRLINLDYKVAKTVIKTHLLTEDEHDQGRLLANGYGKGFG